MDGLDGTLLIALAHALRDPWVLKALALWGDGDTYINTYLLVRISIVYSYAHRYVVYGGGSLTAMIRIRVACIREDGDGRGVFGM